MSSKSSLPKGTVFKEDDSCFFVQKSNVRFLVKDMFTSTVHGEFDSLQEASLDCTKRGIIDSFGDGRVDLEGLDQHDIAEFIDDNKDMLRKLFEIGDDVARYLKLLPEDELQK